MSGPWEKYSKASAQPEDAPWLKYSAKEPRDRTAGEIAGDFGVGIMQGAGGLAGGLAQLGATAASAGLESVDWLVNTATGYDPNSRAYGQATQAGLTEALDESSEFWQSLKSDPLKQREENRGKKIQAADGFLDTAWTAAKETVTDPALLLQALPEQIPNLLGMLSVSRKVGRDAFEEAIKRTGSKEAAESAADQAAQRANLAMTGSMGAGFSAGDAANEVMSMDQDELRKVPEYQELLKQGMEPDAARALLASEAAQYAAAISGPISTVTGKLTSKLESNVARGVRPTEGWTSGLLKSMGLGGVEEVIQEVGEGIGTNVGLMQTADPDREITEGLGERAGMAAVLGPIMEGGMYGLGRLAAPNTPAGKGAEVAEDALRAAGVPLDETPDQTVASDRPAQPDSSVDFSDAPPPGAPPAAEPQRGTNQGPRSDEEMLDELLAPLEPTITNAPEDANGRQSPAARGEQAPAVDGLGIRGSVLPAASADARQVGDAAPTAAPRALDPEQRSRAEFEERLARVAEGLPPERVERLRELYRENRRDRVTGLYRSEDLTETVDIAHEQSGQTPAVYVEMDFANLNGLNKRVGNSGADPFLRKAAEVAKAELEKVGATIGIRKGGDEFGWVVQGATQEQVDSAMERAREVYAADPEVAALADTPNPKEGRGPGIGIHYGTSALEPGVPVAASMKSADTLVERRKEGAPYGRRTGEAAGPDGSVAGAAAQGAGSAAARTGSADQGGARGAQAEAAAEGLSGEPSQDGAAARNALGQGADSLGAVSGVVQESFASPEGGSAQSVSSSPSPGRVRGPQEVADAAFSRREVPYDQRNLQRLPATPTDRSRRLADRVGRALGGGAGSLSVGEVDRRNLPQDLVQALEAFEAATGTEVVLTKGLPINGITFREGEIFVDVSTQYPVLTTAAHEWVHQLRRDNRTLYSLLRDEVKRQGLLPEWTDRMVRRGEDPANKERLLEEMTADAVGDALTDPDFLRQMAERKPTVFRRVVDSFLKFLDRVIASRPNLGSSRYLTDVKAFRDVLADVLEAWQDGMTAQQRGDAVDAAFSRRDLGRGVSREELSTRKPTAKKAAEDPLANVLVVGLDSSKMDRKAFEKNVEIVTNYPNYRDVASANTPDKQAERFINHVRDNLLWLHDQMDAALRQRAKLWYDGANAIANRWADQYGITVAEAGGVLAVLSPQKDWFMNVSLAERVLDTMINRANDPWTADMTATADRIFPREKYAALRDAVDGKTLSEIENDDERALWVRTYDQTYNSPEHPIITPEGEIGGPRLTGAGNPYRVAWGSLGEIGKAVSIIRDPSLANISEMMGDQHKVRNFYNNIVSPASDLGHVTIDTHAVAAGLLRPLAGASAEVTHNFGSGGVSNSSVYGNKGTYGLYAEAYRRAAKARGILPREMQSITWEEVRGLFTPGFKSQAANVEAVDRIWDNFKAGRASYEATRQRVADLAGGVERPDWAGSDPRGDEASRRATFARAVGGAQLPGRSSRDDGGDAGLDSDGAPRFSRRDPGDGGRGRDARSEAPRAGAPLPGAPRVRGASGPDARLVSVAEQYARDNGITLRRQGEYAKVDPERASRIAQAYADMEHAPDDPRVQEAYADLIRQTTAQYRALEEAGYSFWLMDPDNDPYQGNPWNAMRDLRSTQSMAVFPTDSGFGSGATDLDVSQNPLLADTGIRWPYGSPDGPLRPVLANDLFRAVHDAFGHGLEGAGFRADGEENAWQAHVRLFTGPAVGAITSETRGQNSWLNYGPNGEQNRNASVEDTVFADQKTGLMPEWTWTEGRVDDMDGDVAFSRRDPGDVAGPRMSPRDLAELRSLLDQHDFGKDGQFMTEEDLFTEVSYFVKDMGTSAPRELRDIVEDARQDVDEEYRDWGGRGDMYGSLDRMVEQLRAFVDSQESGPAFSRRDPDDQTQTPEFKRWFGDSKVVDENGDPLVVYHGTTGDFDKFNNEFSNPESDWGSGFYFTNTKGDVGKNYSGFGPDLTQKIELLAERIASETDRDYNDPEVIAEARDRFAKNEGLTMPVFVSMQNPAVIGGNNETYLSYELVENEDGDVIDETGTLVDFIVNLRNVSDSYSEGSVEGVVSALLEEGGEVPMSRLQEIISNDEEFGYYRNDEGTLVSKEIAREALELTGFDGIIDSTVDKKFGSQRRVGKKMEGMNPDTVHYIAFRPNQVKSAIGNRGTFDPDNDDIRFSRRDPGIVAAQAQARATGKAFRDLARQLREGIRSTERMRDLARDARQLIGIVSTAPDMDQELKDLRADLTPEKRKILSGDKGEYGDRIREALAEYDRIREDIRLVAAAKKLLNAQKAEANRALDKLERMEDKMSLADRESLVAQLDPLVESAYQAYARAKKIRDFRRSKQYALIKAQEKRTETMNRLAAEGYVQGSVTWAGDSSRWQGVKGVINAMRERLQDRMLALRETQKDIQESLGVILTDAMNVYRLENLMHGRAADRIDQMTRDLVLPLKNYLKLQKINREDLEAYLYARHAKERNAKIASINPRMPDAGSGITNAEADRIMQDFRDRGMIDKLDRAARKADAIREFTLQTLLDSGQITQEMHDKLRASYQHYVPLRGKEDDVDDLARPSRGAGSGLDIRGNPVQRALGRGEGNPAQHIMSELVGDAERAILQAEKARVSRGLLRLALQFPNPEVWKVEPVELEYKFSESTGEVYLGLKNDMADPETVVVKHKGKPYRVRIEDPRLRNAIKNMGVENYEGFVKYLGWVNRYLSAMLTRFNPGFVPVNMVRDMIQGTIGVATEQGVGPAMRVLAHWPHAIKGLWQDSRGKTGGVWQQYAREFAEAGGKTGYMVFQNIEEIQNRIDGDVRGALSLMKEGKPVAAVSAYMRNSTVFQVIEQANDTIENAMRLSAFVEMRKNGASVEAAAEYAKNLTVNFNRKGQLSGLINSFFIFYNAAMQGSYRVAKLMQSKRTWAAMGGMMATQAILAAVGMGMRGDDEDEPLSGWDRIPDYIKQRSMVIPLSADGKYLSIPMPYGFNFFTWLAGYLPNLADRGFRERTSMGDMFNSAGQAVMNAFSPVPIDDGGIGLLPTPIRPFIDVATNETGLGFRIRNENPYSAFPEPRAYSGREDTPELFKMIAKGLNAIGGGDEFSPPKTAAWLLDRAPEDLEYLFDWVGGGPTRIVSQTMTGVEKLLAGSPATLTDVPVLRALGGKIPPRSQEAPVFYDHKEDLERSAAMARDAYKEAAVAALRGVEDVDQEVVNAYIGGGYSAARRVLEAQGFDKDEVNEVSQSLRSISQGAGEAAALEVIADRGLLADGIMLKRNKDGLPVESIGGTPQLIGAEGSVFGTYKDVDKLMDAISVQRKAIETDPDLSVLDRRRRLDALAERSADAMRQLNRRWAAASRAYATGTRQ